MKFRVSLENIEFIAEPDEHYKIIEAIIDVVTPNICKKLYFHASDDLVFETVSKLKLNNLVILDSTSVENICRYKRVYSHNNCVSLVPVLSGSLDKKVWVKYSKDISARYLSAT